MMSYITATEHFIYERLLKGAEFFEEKGMIHIGTTTGKPGHWTAHPYCQRRLRKWIGFGELKYAKTDIICELCFLLFMTKRLTQTVIPDSLTKTGE